MTDSFLRLIVKAPSHYDSMCRELAAEVIKCRETLRAVRRRMHFIGLPSEPLQDGALVLYVPKVPDWAPEIRLIEAALAEESNND